MKAVLRSLEWYNPDVALHNFVPVDPSDCSLNLVASVGNDREPGADIFVIQVCTVKWLERELASDPIYLGFSTLIVALYKYEDIYTFIKDYVERCEGPTWSVVARKVERLGEWEFTES